MKARLYIHVHNNRRCLYVPRLPGSVKNPYNNNDYTFLSISTRISQVYERTTVLGNFQAPEGQYFLLNDGVYRGMRAHLGESDTVSPSEDGK